MSKRINVNLSFTADTTQAKQQIQKLTKELEAVANTNVFTGFSGTMSKEVNEAVKAASQLKSVLKTSIDPNSGLLDASKMSAGLKALNIDLQKTSEKLIDVGPAGRDAFVSMAEAITNAQIPIRKTNSMLDKMWTTLSNTIRWQISASALTGFTSAIQGAYQYAQDLNESLNNIRIVTGYSSDEMEVFAEKANKAAKALSTTTKKYADASLIYFQQGDFYCCDGGFGKNFVDKRV